jgi:hypothetical protein
LIGIRRQSFNPSLPAVVAAALALALAGCGGDDEEDTVATAPQTQTETEESPPAPTVTEAEPQPQETQPEPEPTETAEPPAETAPEDMPGGAGDEEPARSLALFSGDGGRIRPRVVRVPPFISIRVELRSADGAEYALTIGGKTLRVAGGLRSVSTTMDGLRPGAALAGRAPGTPGGVRISATAEPGP